MKVKRGEEDKGGKPEDGRMDEIRRRSVEVQSTCR